MVQETINVKGMHCSSCEILITDEIEELPSAEVSSISFKEGRVTVSYDGAKVRRNELVLAIARAGFEVAR